MFESTIQDVRYAVRLIRRSPLFAATAILSVAIGIGANTTIFSVASAMLLRPLPGVQNPAAPRGHRSHAGRRRIRQQLVPELSRRARESDDADGRVRDQARVAADGPRRPGRRRAHLRHARQRELLHACSARAPTPGRLLIDADDQGRARQPPGDGDQPRAVAAPVRRRRRRHRRDRSAQRLSVHDRGRHAAGLPGHDDDAQRRVAADRGDRRRHRRGLRR